MSKHDQDNGNRDRKCSDLGRPLGPCQTVQNNRLDLLHAAKLTVPQAAKALGVGETKMREFIQTGMIPVVILGGKHLLLEADLEAFLQRHYGPIKETTIERSRLSPLPEAVANSSLLRRAD